MDGHNPTSRRHFLRDTVAGLPALVLQKGGKRETTAALRFLGDDGTTYTVTTDGTKPAPGTKLVSWRLFWGDGRMDSGSGAPPATLGHRYVTEGDYLLRLEVWDSRGGGAVAEMAGSIRFRNVNADTGSLALLTAADLTWKGMWRFPAGEPGAHFSEGPIAHRYVSGQRRWLLNSWPYYGNTFQIREYTAPATYGATRDTAPEMSFVRGWTNVFNIGPDPGNGWCIGDLWYDHAQEVLWYTVYPFYSTGIFPFLGATRLNDNGTTTQYGPWSYISTSETTQHLKQVCKWMVPIPGTAQSACGGRSIAMGADVMSIGATANWGPGLLGMTLPSLGSSSSTPVPIGLPLMAYNATLHGDGHEYYCKRENDYSDLFNSDAIIAPVGAEGYWAVSLDAVGSFSWVETSTKHGIVVFGRRGRGRCWYGSPDAFGNGTLVDQYQSGSGFHAEFYDPALWIFNPAHLLEAAQGARIPYDVGFQSNTNWGTLWPNIPTDPGSPPGGGGIFWTPGGAQHGGAYDATAQEIIWLLPLTYKPGSDRLPTIQVWGV